MMTSSRWRQFVQLLALFLVGSFLSSIPAPAAEPLTDNDKAAMLLAAGQRAWQEKNYPFAIDRFKEFIKTYGGHKDAVLARYGLGIALVEGPQKDFPAAIEALQAPAGKQDFPERAFALYYLGLAHRGLGQLELDQAITKPQEAEQRRNNAKQKFAQAEPQFAAAVTAFAARAAAPPPAGGPSDPAADLAWTARSRCSHAEMLLHLGKFAEARKAVEPLLVDAAQSKSRDRKLAVYQTAYASFALGEFPAAGKALATLAPFDDPVFGVHARYLLARTHHISEERAEALGLYDAVLAGYEQQRKDAQTALQNPQSFKETPDEKTRLETLLKNPTPEYVARSAFYRGVVLYELNRFADSQATFATFAQKYPDPGLAKDVQLRLGMTHVQLRQFPDAIRVLQPLGDHAPLADQAFFWLARAQARLPDNAAAMTEGLKQATESLRKAAERAQQIPAEKDPLAKTRRAEILLEMADTQQQAKQYAEAAGTYQTVVNEKHTPAFVEQAMERQAVAWQLAGKLKESDDACARFLAAFPSSTLLPAVLFRQAENTYLTAVAAAGNPNLPNREQELAKLFGEAIKKYVPLLDKYPEFEYAHAGRQSLASSYHQLGQFEPAIKVLEAVPEADRSGKLASVSYLLADCLVRTLPPNSDDALAAARLMQTAEKAVKLIDVFVSAEPKSNEAPDALLKLGYCYRRMAEVFADPQERNKYLASARQTYEKVTQQYGNTPQNAVAFFERACTMAEQGDVGGAVNEMARFQGDPFKQSSIAPLALLRMSSLLRTQNRAADAVNVLVMCRQQHEGALNGDPTRSAWVPLIQHHHGLALKEQGKLAEARAIFEGIAKQFAARPEAPEAAWRAGQCRRDEAMVKLDAARKILAKPDAKPEEVKAEQTHEQEAIGALRETAKYFLDQAQQLAGKSAGSEPHLRMLYDGAWSLRTVADFEIAAARKQMQADAVKKRQEELAKKAKPGEQVPIVHPPELAASAIPVQPAEQQARDAYKALIAAGPENGLANESRLELAELFARRDEYPAAVPLLTQALDREPPPELADRIRLRLGSCLLSQKDPAGAIAQFDAVALNPKGPLAPEARYRAGECLMAQEDWPKAIARLLPFRDDGALHQVPGISDRAVLRLGHAYARAGQWDQSRQSLEAFAGRYPQSPWLDEARYGIAWAWQNQKQFDQAVNVYVQVVGRTATEVGARAQFQIGLCRLEQKRPAEAANALLVVPFTYDYPEWSALALCEASRAFVDMQQSTQAGKLLERVLKDHPGTPAAEVAKKRLGELK
jgi:tetratricopeptide (TPR) repeat protein